MQELHLLTVVIDISGFQARDVFPEFSIRYRQISDLTVLFYNPGGKDDRIF